MCLAGGSGWRRGFAMVAMGWIAVCLPAAAAEFNVHSYGAVADGTTDDAPSLNQAIKAAIAAGTGSEVVIPAGTYRLHSPLRVDHASGLTVRGEPGTLLKLDDANTEGMNLAGCKNVTVRSLSFDRAQLSFTQGTITAVDPHGMTCDVTIDPGYADPNAPWLAKADLHPFIDLRSGTYKLDGYTPTVTAWQKTGASTWRAQLKGPVPTADWAGKRCFFWAGGSGHCLVGRDLTDCLFEDVNYWGGGGNAGLYLGQLFGTITFRHFVIGVPPGSDRLLSCAGGGQIGDVRGKLVFENCSFTKIDDDGLDILGTWARVLQQTDARTIQVQGDHDFRAGDRIQVWDWPRKQSRTDVRIVRVQAQPDRSVTLVLDQDVKIERAGPGNGQPFGMAARDDGIDRVIDLETQGTQTDIRRCAFQVFRAKCLNLKAANCTVENCFFTHSWQPAISAASEWYFEEGPPIRNLVLRGNQFYNCHHSNIEVGAAPGTGYDQAFGPMSPSRDSTNILIEGNYFAGYGGGKSVFGYWPIGNAIRVQNARQVVIRNNTFGPAAPDAPRMDKILVANSDDVTEGTNYGLVSVPPAPLPQHAVPVTAAQARRLDWFRQAKFGMFIHWGLYAVPAGAWDGATGYGEWMMLSTRMPARQYAKFAPQFDPVDFNPQAWAKLAADAGMKYVVLTAKHHEGFAMWNSQQTDFNVVKATSFGRDVVRELGDACRAQGLRFCVYYSDTDWRDPDFPARYNPAFFHGDPKPDADMATYLAYMKAQLRELLTGYGPLGILWFDNGGGFGGYDMGQVMHGQELVDLVHQLQPDCLVNNRAGVPGDYVTPEQEIPPAVLPEPWETCMTMNEHWGYNQADHDWKSPEVLIHNLVDIVSKGGNYLLNVGPTAQGVIPDAAAERLEEIGRWLQVNGQAVYGAGPTPFGAELGAMSTTQKDAAGKPAFVPGDKWRFTTKPGKLFVILYQWPGTRLELPPLKAPIRRAVLLAEPAVPLAITQGTGPPSIALPAEAPDRVASVVALDLGPEK